MILLIIILALIVASLTINAGFKLKSYNKEEKSIWQDGDSVRILGPNGEAHKDGFMSRIS